MLPPEIWLRIHFWATFVPNAFDKDVPDPFSYPPPLSQDEIQDEMRRSLKTKHALVLVCKLWNELSTRFLYEAVYVGMEKTLRTLEDLLVKELGDEETNRTKGAMKLWTRRLDFAIRNPEKKTSKILRFALLLRNFMPKLEIFVARKTDMQNLLAQRLLATFACCAAQLTTFDSTHMLYDSEGGASDTSEDDEDWAKRSNSNSWSILLHQFGSVRRLNIVPNRTTLSVVRAARRATAPLSFPHLQYLHVTERFPLYVDLNCDDPNSTTRPFHLVSYNGLESNHAKFMADFIDRSPGLSSRLTTFEWRATYMESLQPLLNTIAKRCPCLENLIFAVPTWPMLTFNFQSTTLPKSIQRIGLRSYKQEGGRSVMRRLCDGVSQISETAESLRVVRFLDRQTVRNLREVNPKIAHQMKARLDIISISLEASDGQPLLQ